MIGKKAMMKLQRRLMRASEMNSRLDTEKSGLSASDYEILCRTHDMQSERQAAPRSSRSLILK